MMNRQEIHKKAKEKYDFIRKYFLVGMILFGIGCVFYPSMTMAEEGDTLEVTYESSHCPASIEPVREVLAEGLDGCCWFNPPLKMFFEVADRVGEISHNALVKSSNFLPMILSIGFAFWLAFQILRYVSPLYPQDPGDFFMALGIGLFKFVVAFFLLTADGVGELFDKFIGVFVTTSGQLGAEIVLGKLKDIACNGVTDCLVPPESSTDKPALAVYYAIENLTRAAGFKFKLAAAYGQTIFSFGFKQPFWGIFCVPHVGIMLGGGIIYLIALFFLLLIPLKLVDIALRIALLYALLPIFVVAWAFPQTKKYATVAWGMVMYIVTFLLIMAVLVCVAAELITNGANIDPQKVIAGGDVGGATLIYGELNIEGEKFLSFLLAVFIAIKAFGTTSQLSGYVSGGAGGGLGESTIGKALGKIAGNIAGAGGAVIGALGGSAIGKLGGAISGARARRQERKSAKQAAMAGVLDRAKGLDGKNSLAGNAGKSADAGLKSLAGLEGGAGGGSFAKTSDDAGINAAGGAVGNASNGTAGRKAKGSSLESSKDAGEFKEGVVDASAKSLAENDAVLNKIKDALDKGKEDALDSARRQRMLGVDEALKNQGYVNDKMKQRLGNALSDGQGSAMANAISFEQKAQALKAKMAVMAFNPIRNKDKLLKANAELREIRRAEKQALKEAAAGNILTKIDMKALLRVSRNDQTIANELESFKEVTYARDAKREMAENGSSFAEKDGKLYVADESRVVDIDKGMEEYNNDFASAFAVVSEKLGGGSSEGVEEGMGIIAERHIAEREMEQLNIEKSGTNRKRTDAEIDADIAAKQAEIDMKNEKMAEISGRDGVDYEGLSDIIKNADSAEQLEKVLRLAEIKRMDDAMNGSIAIEAEGIVFAAGIGAAKASVSENSNDDYYQHRDRERMENKTEEDRSNDEALKSEKKLKKLMEKVLKAKSRNEALKAKINGYKR